MAEKSWLQGFAEDDDNRRLFEGARLITQVTEVIASAIEDRGLARSEVAERMGKSGAFVSQLLAGDRNMTLRSVAELGYAAGIRLDVTARAISVDAFTRAPVTFVRPTRTVVTASPVEASQGSAEEGERVLAA